MNELIGLLVKQLGVKDNQATGGAGLLFKLAQEKLGAADFGKVASSLGGVQDLIKSAPAEGGAAKMLGGLASMLGGGTAGKAAGGVAALAQLASGFSKLGLDKDMIAKFVPVILSFAQSKGGDAVKTLLQKALSGV